VIDKKIWRKDFHILANHFIGLINFKNCFFHLFT
jgi:hypothetical protein